MRVGLFCKTCAADLPWFRYAFASFKKFWQHADTNWVVVLDRDCQLLVDKMDVKTYFVDSWPDKYCHAMAMKACADLFLPDCEMILLFDSDMMMTKAAELRDLTPLPEGKPAIYYEHWNAKSSSMMARRVWAPASMRSTGRLLDRDYMRAPVWLFYASTFRHARRLVEQHTGLPFLQAVYSPVPYDWRQFQNHPMTFCDMENLALAALIIEREKYQFIPIDQHEPFPIRQHWSHSDFAAAEPELKKILDA